MTTTNPHIYNVTVSGIINAYGYEDNSSTFNSINSGFRVKNNVDSGEKDNAGIKMAGKRKFYFSIAAVLVFTSLLICLFCFIIPWDAETAAAGTQINKTAEQTITPQPTPAQTPSPKPTPTPDPNDKYFAETETVNINEDESQWIYSSPELYIHITRHDNYEQKLHYYVAEIRTRGSKLFKSAFSDPKHPGGNRLLPKPFACNIGAVYMQNGDFFVEKTNPVGVVIKGGIVYRDKKSADTLAVMPDGTLNVYKGGEIKADDLLKLGVMDTFSFGPILIRDGVIAEGLDKARLRKPNPRSGIGMIEKGHYIGIVVEGKNPKSCRGVSLQEFAQMFADEGCVVAYNLDGGASSAMVFMGETINLPTSILTTKTHRKIPDSIFIGTSDSVPKK